VPPTLNIAALTKRTGVPPDTIRKWEQRYGVLRPERTAGGQRRYTELDVARVEWLQARLAEGYRIGEAAALLGPRGAAPLSASDLQRAIVDATAASDIDALARLVGQAVALPSLERAFAEVLAPALVEVGERWAAGTLTVAQKHLASSTVRGALQRLLADARASVRGVAVLACAPGERHEIGLLMLAVMLRADGWQVAYLGADAPLGDTVALAQQLNASALCFSASGIEAARALKRDLDAHRLPPGLTVLTGGRATKASRDIADAVKQLRKAAA
jgi:MerR family transcriptional regulator, light-induced transcriptional regulator